MRHATKTWLSRATTLARAVAHRGRLARLAAAGLLLAAAATGPSLAADPWPSRPIRVVVPAPPGGALDTTARLFAQSLAEVAGASVVVDNRGGGNGLIGTAFVTNAQPDGYTLLMAYNAPLTVNFTQTKDGIADLDRLRPLATVAEIPQLFIVRPDLPLKTFADFIAYARRDGADVKLGINGVGSAAHFLTVKMLEEAGLGNIQLVPYQGAAPALRDLLGGLTTGQVETVGGALPHIRSGRVVPLLVLGRERSPLLPAVPTSAEAGFPGIHVHPAYHTLLLPAGTPAPIVQKLGEHVKKVVESEAFRERLAAGGSVARWRAADDTLSGLLAERKSVEAMVRAGALKLN